MLYNHAIFEVYSAWTITKLKSLKQNCKKKKKKNCTKTTKRTNWWIFFYYPLLELCDSKFKSLKDILKRDNINTENGSQGYESSEYCRKC